VSDASLHYAQNSRINQIAGNVSVNPYEFSRWSAAGAAQLKLIFEEIEETIAAAKAGNFKELRDGLADSIVTLDGFFHRLELTYPEQVWLKSEVDQYSGITPQGVENLLMGGWRVLDTTFYSITTLDEYVNQHEYLTKTASYLLVQLYAVAKQYNVPVQDDQDAVYTSNLSKFDTDYVSAVESLARYVEQNVCATLERSVVDGERYFILKVMEDSVNTQGKFFPAGKFLKSQNFKEPVFQDLGSVA